MSLGWSVTNHHRRTHEECRITQVGRRQCWDVCVRTNGGGWLTWLLQYRLFTCAWKWVVSTSCIILRGQRLLAKFLHSWHRRESNGSEIITSFLTVVFLQQLRTFWWETLTVAFCLYWTTSDCKARNTSSGRNFDSQSCLKGLCFSDWGYIVDHFQNVWGNMNHSHIPIYKYNSVLQESRPNDQQPKSLIKTDLINKKATDSPNHDHHFTLNLYLQSKQWL